MSLKIAIYRHLLLRKRKVVDRQSLALIIPVEPCRSTNGERSDPLILHDGFRPPPASLPALDRARLTSLSPTLCLSVEIQAISYSAILTGEHCVVADQTGSGKTLAYLAPLVQRLRYVWVVRVGNTLTNSSAIRNCSSFLQNILTLAVLYFGDHAWIYWLR